MSDFFQDLNDKEDLIKMRVLFVGAIVCSFVFYYFLVRLSEGRDFFPGRIGTAVVATLAFVLSYVAPRITLSHLFKYVMLSYVFLYIYLLHINDWSVFHRWSYFVVGALFCTSVPNWRDFPFTATVTMVTPIIAGFYSPLTVLELVHFHTANLTVFFIIGVSIKSVFHYRQEVMKLTKTLVQSSKMAALGEMAGGIAHEINTPLSIIIGYVDLVKNQLSDGNKFDEKKTHELLDKIEMTSFRISQIIQGLRHFSREGSEDRYEITDLRDVVSESLHLCTEKFKINKINLITTISPTPVMCNCQRIQIIQILINLLNNAYDACNTLPNPKIRITLEAKDIYALITVTDSGPGVPSNLDSKIMQPFFTTKEVGSGTGLGLSVSLGIANAHKGFLYLDRSISPSTFVLKLPLAV
ncbi:MAG: hypothetical protein A2622_00260 [Bdellovibrionales bacterium RIFCSPHIGHO2_01_FULL_40_29]|nr:MAG: hypothetical protein A2622_00260 [Bdellovibrionales bacterium RIFCSPHIGHO2_01_FULL_40_29]OFZ32559.1 MAG: hypothetical protein A3D17_04860 [Bdellovibrionales bacterium RIFCSPHIGHO2_02_FULL_40_15]